VSIVPAHSRSLENLLLVTAVGISLLVSLPRLAPGLPMGVDSSSHLPKVIFISDSLIRYGRIPLWNPDWYAGTPFLLLYSPLSYVLTGLLGVLIGPVLAYKLIDLVFYVAAPIAVFLLAKDFGLPRLESACAAVLYSTVPEVVSNYIFFGRFPTTISIILLCFFLISLRRVLRSLNVRRVIVPSILLASIVLTHHLSGLIAVLVACIYIVAAWPRREKAIHHLGIGLGVIVAGLVLAAFWLIPYVGALSELPENPFFNRNVTFPFLKFMYFGVDVAGALLGIAQFILAVVGFQILAGKIYRPKLRFQPVHLVLSLLAGMVPYQVGEMLGASALMQFGIALIVLAFVAFLAEILQRCFRGTFERATEGHKFLCLWFLFFLWAGLGYYAIPIVWFQPFKTIWMSLDVERFWLYLAIPMVALAAVGAVRAVRKVSMKSRFLAALLIVLICVPVFVSPALRVWYAVSQPINSHLPFSAANSEIPSELISYFDGEASSGRLLGVKCPLWVYLLPSYTGKPIIDGWYPQSKLVRILVDVNDYRIDDLETAESDNKRIAIWRNLIDHSDLLGIEWLMICDLKPSERRMLVENSTFGEVLTTPYEDTYISIYKSTPEVKLAVITPPDNAKVGLEWLSPDHIRLRLSHPPEGAIIQVRVAYFPTWTAVADGKPVPVTADKEGYIQLKVDSWMTTIDIVQQGNRPLDSVAWALSAVALISLLAIAIVGPRHAKN